MAQIVSRQVILGWPNLISEPLKPAGALPGKRDSKREKDYTQGGFSAAGFEHCGDTWQGIGEASSNKKPPPADGHQGTKDSVLKPQGTELCQ